MKKIVLCGNIAQAFFKKCSIEYNNIDIHKVSHSAARKNNDQKNGNKDFKNIKNILKD